MNLSEIFRTSWNIFSKNRVLLLLATASAVISFLLFSAYDGLNAQSEIWSGNFRYFYFLPPCLYYLAIAILLGPFQIALMRTANCLDEGEQPPTFGDALKASLKFLKRYVLLQIALMVILFAAVIIGGIAGLVVIFVGSSASSQADAGLRFLFSGGLCCLAIPAAAAIFAVTIIFQLAEMVLVLGDRDIANSITLGWDLFRNGWKKLLPPVLVLGVVVLISALWGWLFRGGDQFFLTWLAMLLIRLSGFALAGAFMTTARVIIFRRLIGKMPGEKIPQGSEMAPEKQPAVDEPAGEVGTEEPLSAEEAEPVEEDLEW